VFLALLQVDILGCVAMDGASIYQTSLGEGIHLGCLNPGSTWGDGLSGSACYSVDGFSRVVLQGAGM
jgi:hypothetical protein